MGRLLTSGLDTFNPSCGSDIQLSFYSNEFM